MQKLSRLRDTVQTWHSLGERAKATLELLELSALEDDESLANDIADEAAAIETELDRREFDAILSGEYDDRNAIIAIHAGAGGTDSQDWTEMLLRMYTRWAERQKFRTELLDVSTGEEAGIKSATLEIQGANAYGYAKAERGVHRLVRLSPYDSAHARHTSFALVEVLPEAEGDVDVTVDPDDLRIDVFKASGAGGQHVQKNATAVRFTHLPTGVVVSCQNERSQLQNKETAMKILKARLMELAMKRRAEERNELKGEHIAAGWGNQIRSYVLHPYKMVKDHRTGFESTNPDAVLDGEIEPMVQAYLLSTVEGE
jgi:peptide chain release factor 2